MPLLVPSFFHIVPKDNHQTHPQNRHHHQQSPSRPLAHPTKYTQYWPDSTPVESAPSSAAPARRRLVVIGHTQPHTALEARHVATIHHDALSLAGNFPKKGEGRKKQPKTKFHHIQGSIGFDLKHVEDEILRLPIEMIFHTIEVGEG